MHGKRLHEAEAEFYELLNRARVDDKPQQVRFITGQGAIQQMLQKMAKEHDLEAYILLANRGVLVVHFE